MISKYGFQFLCVNDWFPKYSYKYYLCSNRVNTCLYFCTHLRLLPEIFKVQNFQGLVILKFFANNFSRMTTKQEVVTCMHLNFRGCRKNPKCLPLGMRSYSYVNSNIIARYPWLYTATVYACMHACMQFKKLALYHT